jgi:hypothetical protein
MTTPREWYRQNALRAGISSEIGCAVGIAGVLGWWLEVPYAQYVAVGGGLTGALGYIFFRSLIAQGKRWD